MSNALMNTYRRMPVSFTRGEGAWLYDADGKAYLDALSGIAVCSLGHAHPAVTEAVQGGRRPFHTDALLTRIADGTWTAPAAGDTVTDPDGAAHAWASKTVGDNGWFEGPELRGGYIFWSVEAATPAVDGRG